MNRNMERGGETITDEKQKAFLHDCLMNYLAAEETTGANNTLKQLPVSQAYRYRVRRYQIFLKHHPSFMKSDSEELLTAYRGHLLSNLMFKKQL